MAVSPAPCSGTTARGALLRGVDLHGSSDSPIKRGSERAGSLDVGTGARPELHSPSAPAGGCGPESRAPNGPRGQTRCHRASVWSLPAASARSRARALRSGCADGGPPGRPPFLAVGGGQSAVVELAVQRERQCAQRHKYRRDHVRREMALQVSAQIYFVDFLTGRHKVGISAAVSSLPCSVAAASRTAGCWRMTEPISPSSMRKPRNLI